MKKLLFCVLFAAFFVISSNGQEMPAKIRTFLDSNFNSKELGRWKAAPGNCGDQKWIAIADFDGDSLTDYLIRFTTGKTKRTTRLHLIAFFNRNGAYTPESFFEGVYDERLKRSSSAIVKKGTTVSLGLGEEGEGPTMVLKTDGIVQFVCETDDSATFFYRNGAMKNISEAVSNSLTGSAKIMASSDKSQQMPRAIEQYLDKNFSGWEISPASDLCGEKKLFAFGDFNGDGKRDLVVHFLLGKNTNKNRLLLYGFINNGRNYEPIKIAKNDNREDFGMLSFVIVNKGKEIPFSNGEESDVNHVLRLGGDAITLFKCETDASSTFIFQNGRFRNIGN